jgi:hypothetical protein
MRFVIIYLKSLNKIEKAFTIFSLIYIVAPFDSPFDPPAPPPTVTGSVGSGLAIGSGDSSMLPFEVFFESVVRPSGFSFIM